MTEDLGLKVYASLTTPHVEEKVLKGTRLAERVELLVGPGQNAFHMVYWCHLATIFKTAWTDVSADEV
jgi:hypothetical protein